MFEISVIINKHLAVYKGSKMAGLLPSFSFCRNKKAVLISFSLFNCIKIDSVGTNVLIMRPGNGPVANHDLIKICHVF